MPVRVSSTKSEQMKTLIIALSLAGLALPARELPIAPDAPPRAGTTGYELVKKQGQVALYERWLEVEPGRQARELKAEFIAPASPQALLELLRDESKALAWMRHAGACRILEDNDDGWLAYVRYDLPWPVSDQDCLLRYELHKNGGSAKLGFRSASDGKAPPRRGVKRMAGVSGAWLLEPVAGGRSKVSYTVITTERPSLPRWITDPIVQGNLLDTMNAFLGQL